MKTVRLLPRHQGRRQMRALRFTSMGSLLHAILLSGAVMLALANPAYAETISPRRLLEVTDFSALAVSPDGTRVAFRVEQAVIERNAYDATWYVQDMDGSAPPRRLADGGVPLRDSAGVSLPMSVVWSPDGRWIYYRAQLDDRIDVWRAATDGGDAEPLTRDPANVRDFSLSVDGRTLRYSVGATREAVADAEMAEYDRGIRIDRTVAIGQGLFRSGNVDGRLATQRFDRQWYEPEPLLADVPDHWKVLDLVTRRKRNLEPANPPQGPLRASDIAMELPDLWKVKAAPDDEHIALLIRSGDGTGLRYKPDVELAMLPNRNARRPIACQAELCKNKAITNIQWRPDSDEVLFTVTDPLEGLAQSVFRWNVRTGAVQPVVRTDGLISGGRDRYSGCGVSSDALACVAADADRPPRLERIDLETGQRQVLFDPNAALALDMAAAAPARLLRWTDTKGNVFTGQFFPARTTNGAPPPLFVTYYNCSGFLRGGVGDEWPLASFAEHGISALCINQAPLRLDAVERYSNGLSAVESIVNLLASNGEIDRTKVGMGGHSFGSEVTLWTAVHSNVIAAASISSPSIEPNYYLLRILRGGDAFLANLMQIWQLGSPEETPEKWKVISPAFQLDKITAPILMQIPEQEYMYGLCFAMPLLMDNRGDLYVFPHEPHQKFQPRHNLAAYERNLDWFRFWLLNQEDMDPAKAEQYAHWSGMRAIHEIARTIPGSRP
jgi:dipeptidyl aminopeptidase/acylaminoacyl peptidase